MSLAKAGFVLSVKPVSTLRPHEEVIPSHVRGLATEMSREGIQKDPIIVDRESLTVLDGMHRLAAFGSLGVENAVCCSVEYSSRSVALRRWARVYRLPRGEPVSIALERAGLGRRTSIAQAFDELEGLGTGLALLTSDAAYLPEGKMDLPVAMGAIAALDRLADDRGWERRFAPEDDIDVPLQADRNIVVLMRKLRKDDVVQAARTGRLMPCKTSMHLIDPRPVAVNFPLAELNGATSASLKARLEGKKEVLLPVNSLYEGRRYKERLLLLSQD